jgi:hypothetical protein
MFLHSIIYFLNIDINKQFVLSLNNTNDVNNNFKIFSDYNSIKFNFKSCDFSCINGAILDITFKFNIGLDMQLIYTCLYALRKK